MWLRECDTQHKCAPSGDTSLPTRILKIGLDSVGGPIILVESEGRKGRYAALSHCWGPSQPFITTRTTIEDRKRGIDFQSLPLTFKNCIFIAQYLRIRYVWIDSLCILQDDDLDWELEASRMAEVYANAYLTIAASSSASDSGGCFPDSEVRLNRPYLSPEAESMGLHLGGRRVLENSAPFLGVYPYTETASRPMDSLYTVVAQHPYVDYGVSIGDDVASKIYVTKGWMPTSNKSQPQVFKIGEYGSEFDPLRDEPLNSRAWTLQERILSPRILHYGTDQMYWECRECLLAEDGTRFNDVFCSVESILQGQALPDSDHGLPKSGQLSLREDFPTMTRHGRWKNGWVKTC
jgi:Heterokaryon incompatibility protein (HET)